VIILHQDERVVAINKPSGISVHRGQGERVVAMTLLRDRLGRWVYPVHRLDRATSGVLIFALDPKTAAKLSASFAEGSVAKTYLALCRGAPAEQGRIDHPVPNDEDGDRVPAVTNYRRLWTDGRYAWVELSPETGRYHQIRRHMKHISHHLIGDVRYGKGEHNRLFRERFGLRRLALHASKLEIPDPSGGALIRLEAPLPDDLRLPLLNFGVPLT
jgi:tRNA pseudouridine65 synthase